jgi:hypothetical protein
LYRPAFCCWLCLPVPTSWALVLTSTLKQNMQVEERRKGRGLAASSRRYLQSSFSSQCCFLQNVMSHGHNADALISSGLSYYHIISLYLSFLICKMIITRLPPPCWGHCEDWKEYCRRKGLEQCHFLSLHSLSNPVKYVTL